MRRLRLFSALAITLTAALAAGQTGAGETYDVVVVSGSSGGFGAALAAGRMGMRVALIEDTPVLGGMLSNGISNIDTYSFESLSGIFEEFRSRVKEHYGALMATDPIFRAPRLLDYKPRQSNVAAEGGRWEPHVADQILKEMIAPAPGVTIFYNTWATDAVLQGNRAAGVMTMNKRGERRVFTGKVIIDATHEADVAAWAGVPYRVGREARSPLEPHAGDIRFFNGTGEIMEGSTGRQDRAIVSYGLRLCIQHYGGEETSHILASPPPGYDKSKYLHSSYSGEITMPKSKAEMNANPVGNEMQEINWVWPEASRAERMELYQRYKNHALGFLYFLQHERGLKHLGLPKDEFVDNGHVPYRIFVREARRIEGEATITEADINPFLTGRGLIPQLRKDSISIGHYPLDSKPVHSKTDMSTPEKGNGDFFLANVVTPFQVPYGAIVPLHVEGLLVPVAVSATHVAFSAVRMDPTWMVMGQAAGVAAALSIRENVTPRQLPVERLQRELIRQKVRLLFYWDVSLDHPAFEAIQWLSVRKGLRGYPDRLFRPDQYLSRAEMSVLIANVFGLWPSVSNFHFTDVPWSHWAFREIETLFDNRLLTPFGVRPRWPDAGGYDPVRNAGFRQGQNFGAFEPDRPVTWGEMIGVLRILQSRQVHPPAAGPARKAFTPPEIDPGEWVNGIINDSRFASSLRTKTILPAEALTRAEACMLVAAMSERR
ncbi:MAG: FAD-dependent oxidoreductase [Bryobacteraceae bacterium]|nr:FAD-dependent oxidoreductase [Bryobacterales bacterium]MEB2361540.1 FAD-dependent oxidoreductase [Bryobacterales bacterium]NUN02722.1 FAD-dependent oxidoreductase [Bryobacteraceae bacterium]